MNTGEVDLRSLGGVVSRALAALVSRTVAMQLVVLGGTVALTRLLGPREFGIFAIVRAALAVLVFFGDTGVGGALVRQKEEPSERQLSSLFHFQLAVAVAIMALIVALAGLLPAIWPDLPASAPLLLRVLAIDVVLVCLRITPLLLLERRLEFGKLAAIEVAGSMTFYGAAVALAASGFGVWALAAGVLAQGLLVTLVVFALSPWRPRLVFGWSTLRPMMRFGIAQQSRNLIGLINGSLTPFYGGRALGTTAVGYVNWAQETAYFPLRLVEILARVGFPLFARLQHDRALLSESLGRTVQLSAFFTFAWVGLCLGLGEQLTLVVFTAKWLPAVPILIVFAAAIAIGFLSPLVAVALDAIGRPGIFARAALGWTILNWIVVPIATVRWQTLGFAIGYAVHVVVGNIVIASVAHRFFPEARLWSRVRAPLAAGAAVALVGRLVLAPRVTGLWSFGLSVAAMAVLYIVITGVMDGRALLRALSVVPRAVEREHAAGLAQAIT
jgi:teichuronic acid exporter